MQHGGPPPSAAGIDPADLVALRDRLGHAGLDDHIFRVTETIGAGMIDPLRLPLVRQALRARGDAVSTLALLLVYATPVAEKDLRAAVGDAASDLLIRCGIVAPAEDGEVVSRLRVTPFGPLLIAADHPDAGPEAVMTPGGTTSLLANLIPDEISGRVLDVGTGPGTLALLAAARGADAVGTDVSERALAFASFNATLNGLSVDLRLGDLLAPVAGEQFALVVSQPPYVVQPQEMEHVTFMHGGTRGDDLALALAAAVSDVLTPGGVALLKFDMPLADGETATEHVRAVVGPAVSVAVFEQPGAGFHLQAVSYAALHDPTLGADFAERARMYCAHFAGLGVRRAAATTVVLVRPADAAAPRFTAGVAARALSDWDALRRRLTALEAAVQDDDGVLGIRVRAAEGCRLAVEREVDGADGERRYFARFEPGAAVSDTELAPIEAALLQRVGGGALVADVVAGFADEIGAEPAAAAEPVLNFVRENVARGLLVLADQ